MSRSISLLLLLSCLVAVAPARTPFADLFFEPNRGQSPAAVRYVARSGGAAFQFRADCVSMETGESPVELRFAGASRTARFEPLDATSDQTFYILGSDPSRWMRNVPHYRRLAWRGVYPGIDVVFYGSGGKLEYD